MFASAGGLHERDKIQDIVFAEHIHEALGHWGKLGKAPFYDL